MMTAIIAHRGASALATHENTLEAFQIAINLQECGQEHFVTHPSDVQCNVVADHRIHHDEHHHNRKNNLLKLCFWHKKTSLK